MKGKLYQNLNNNSQICGKFSNQKVTENKSSQKFLNSNVLIERFFEEEFEKTELKSTNVEKIDKV